jgi:hypothetical protein
MNSYDQAMIGTFPDDAWKSAEFCGPNGGNCVEVNLGVRGAAGLRDSKSPARPALAFDDAGWTRFLAATKTSRLERG